MRLETPTGRIPKEKLEYYEKHLFSHSAAADMHKPFDVFHRSVLGEDFPREEALRIYRKAMMSRTRLVKELLGTVSEPLSAKTLGDFYRSYWTDLLSQAVEVDMQFEQYMFKSVIVNLVYNGWLVVDYDRGWLLIRNWEVEGELIYDFDNLNRAVANDLWNSIADDLGFDFD